MRNGLALHRASICASLLLAAGAPFARADVSPDAAMLRWPDVSATQIVFSYANDLWIVPKAGGVASPLASPPGQESFPRFSPDGKVISFVGNYDGNRDLYTISVSGGVPTRVTHHPAGEALCDFTPKGDKLLYLTNGFAGLPRQTQLFTSPVDGGLPQQIPVPYAGFGAISPDGQWLAYTPHSTDNRTWKRYRGGMATDVWLFNLSDSSSKRVTDWEGTDTIPMWVPDGDGKTLYYLSDNGPEHRLNIWAYDVASAQRRQVTNFADDDVRWPSVGPGTGGTGEIVFQLGSALMLLDLSTGKSARVDVTIPGDRPKLRTRFVDAAKNLASGTLSPTGKRVVVEARGDLWSVPAKEGVTRALTRTDGFAERDPSWSPDNKWLAYFSDESGEYELWIRPTDARAPEDEKDDSDAKPDAESDAKADEKAKADAEKAAAEPTREPRKLTSLGAGFRFNPSWSPDSKLITFTDQNGRLFLTTVESGDTKEIDKDPWMNQLNVSWSSDSRWIAYSKADDGNSQGCVWIMNVTTGEKTQVTSSMFNSGSPAFDRKGDWLFFTSNRSIENPVYSDLDTSFIYPDTGVVLMTPLRADVKSPWLSKSDEETFKVDAKKADEKKDGDKAGKKDDTSTAADVANDPISGTWTGVAKGQTPETAAGLPFTFKLTLDKEGAVTGSLSSAMGTADVTGAFDKDSKQLTLSFTLNGQAGSLTGVIDGESVSGTWSVADAGGDWSAKRTQKKSAEEAKKDDAGDKKKDESKVKEVKIDLEGLEARAFPLPIRPGAFGALAVADGEKLIYARRSARGGPAGGQEGGVKIFDYTADEKEEKAVTGGGGFQLSADGKKLLVMRGGSSMIICDPAAGGGKTQNVPVGTLMRPLEPREEWKQIFSDAWRLQRDFFYEPTMHGVDWAGMRTHYGAMVDHAASREDLNWIIAEMISELNIGHAYVMAPGDVEQQPTVGVGLLGCDFELDSSGAAPAYRIKRIIGGAAWDTDARSPLAEPGMKVKEGDYLLAVNGIPVDPKRDPYASFIGTVGQITSLTINAAPTMDGKQHEVLVTPVGSEVPLRYRDWIERKRAYVDEKSGGKVGYIYVPNTGQDGQSDLFRQFFGQRQKDALIIDERWNGGGQIPTRFIELLNRRPVNFWARRDGNDWPWPPDAHFGPKCMLINGLAGSGGDDFPWLFKHDNIGKVIGTRTWGGLVGISGNPGFVDGGTMSVPTFGFYELDGTWGVEGHGVDPDIEVLDDPAKMVNDGDPQLDVAINLMADQIKSNPFTAPKRPASPNRKGMGLDPRDR